MTDEQIQSIAQMTAQCVKEFYKDLDNLKRFEEWLKLLDRGVGDNESKH